MYPDGLDILVVDHDPARRSRIEQIVAREGFTAAGANEGLAALRLLGQRRFALIIAAIGLPGSLDGLATVRQARARQPWLRALFTGDAAERPRRGDPEGDDFIAAPFHPSELLGCVFELLHREAASAGCDGPRGRSIRLCAS